MAIIWNEAFKQIKVLTPPDNPAIFGFFIEGTKIPETTIIYNDSLVASFDVGTATLPVKDLKMKTDIVITVPEAEGGTDATEAEMTALLTSGEVGGVYKYVGTSGTYENGALYVLEAEMYTISVTTDGAVRGVDSITHIKFNSPPTSADDYDRTSEDGSATVTASKAQIWGGGYILNDGGEMYTYDYDYSTAKEVIFTQDSSLSIATLYASGGGSND